MVPAETRTHLSSHPTSAGAARRFVREALHEAGLPDELSHSALLCTDELVTNAIVHVGSDVDVVVRAGAGRLRVEVYDAGPRPPLRSVPPVDAESGRGLRLVEALAERWGVTTCTGGKAVWFEMPLPDGDALTFLP